MHITHLGDGAWDWRYVTLDEAKPLFNFVKSPMSKFRAIKDFIDHWQDSDGCEISAVGNCTIPVTVTYCFDGKEIEEQSSATFIRNSYDDGKIRLVEQGVLSAELFHLDFNPDFQEYKFRESDHAFQIDGSSPKMHGAYKVVLMPG